MVESKPKPAVRKAPKPADVVVETPSVTEKPAAKTPSVKVAKPAPVTTVPLSSLPHGAIFEVGGQRFIKEIPVQKGKEVGQRLNWLGGSWIRGSAASFDLDTQVNLVKGGN